MQNIPVTPRGLLDELERSERVFSLASINPEELSDNELDQHVEDTNAAAHDLLRAIQTARRLAARIYLPGKERSEADHHLFEAFWSLEKAQVKY
jgi:hypothetical protein